MRAYRPGSVAPAFVALALAVAAGSRPLAVAQVPEHEVRAAFVYNFTKFIEWPAAAVPPTAFHICVVGDNRLSQSLLAMVKDETVQGRPIALVAPAAESDVTNCQILYVGQGEAVRGRRALNAARQLPILTVGDSPRFLDDGGAIRFVIEGDRVKFDVNLPAVERAGLSVASAVLRVARHVEKTSP